MRPSYANVVSTLALVVSLGAGGAYAAEKLPKHSVGAKQLKKNAVTSTKVKDGSIAAADLAPGAVPPGAVGTPMGGDLTGVFPNPRVDVGALNGVVKGKGSGLVTVPAGDGFAPVLAVPGLARLDAECKVSGTDRQLTFRLTNATASQMSFAYRASEQGSPGTTNGGSFGPNDYVDIFAPAGPGNDRARSLELAVYGATGALFDVLAVAKRTGTGSCVVVGSVTTG